MSSGRLLCPRWESCRAEPGLGVRSITLGGLSVFSKVQNAEEYGLYYVPVTKVLVSESLQFLIDSSFGFLQ